MKIGWQKNLVLIALITAISTPSFARYTQAAKVRYDTSEGESRWQETDVSFLTSDELNNLTGSLRYGAFKHYATIYFGDDGGKANIAVIRLDSPMIICGMKFEQNCLPLMGKMKGPDQEGRVWEICTGLYC